MSGDFLRPGTLYRNNEHTMPESCIFHDHAIGEKKAALELPCGNAAMQKLPPAVILPSPSQSHLSQIRPKVILIW